MAYNSRQMQLHTAVNNEIKNKKACCSGRRCEPFGIMEHAGIGTETYPDGTVIKVEFYGKPL